MKTIPTATSSISEPNMEFSFLDSFPTSLRTTRSSRALPRRGQYNDGRAEPPSSAVFTFAMVCVPSFPPQEKSRYT